MPTNLVSYLQDHLLGAALAIELLEELKTQTIDEQTRTVAAELVPEIQADQKFLEEVLETQHGISNSYAKQAVGWIGQKIARWKLDVTTPLGVFESVEMLCLGVLGKIALWRALQLQPALGDINFTNQLERANVQHDRLEQLRLKLGVVAFAT